jgi:hypothetical protein
MSAHIEELERPWSHGREFTQQWQSGGSAGPSRRRLYFATGMALHAGTRPGRYHDFIVMEYVRGKSLDALIP